MQINVSTVHREIQRFSQSGPIKFQELARFLGVRDLKQCQKLDRIVKHLAGQNMIICQGASIKTRNQVAAPDYRQTKPKSDDESKSCVA